MVFKVCFRAWRRCCTPTKKNVHRPQRHGAPESPRTPLRKGRKKPEAMGPAYQKRVCALGIAGALVAIYAMHVEHAMADPFYEPACVTRWGSCAAVFSSAYAHPLSLWGLVAPKSDFDFSLASLGVLNYGVFALFPVWPLGRDAAATALLVVSVCSCLFSCYLLYVLKVVLQDFCIVCTTFHVINFSTLFFGAVPVYRSRAALTKKGE